MRAIVLIALRSSGLHSNGFSLARHVLFDLAGWKLDRDVEVLGRTLGEELLEPTRVYALDCLALTRDPACGVHAFSHITGGGLAENLVRVLPAGVRGTIDRSTWTPQPIFGVVAELGSVPAPEMERTFNMGVGMVAVCSRSGASAALARLSELGVDAWACGTVDTGESRNAPPSVEVAGFHA